MAGRIAFYEFKLNTAAGEHLGGTGIYLTSLVNFLKAQRDRVSIRFIPCEPSHSEPRSLWEKSRALLGKGWADIRDLLAAGEETLLFHYPKMPIIGRSNYAKVLAFAALGYGLLAIKKTVTGQRAIVLIQDLPTEQRLIRPSSSVPDLTRFHNWRRLPKSEWALTAVERLIFKLADVVVAPSSMLADHIARKHSLPASKIVLKRRDIYAPTYDSAPKAIEVDSADGPRVFYSGDLGLPSLKRNLKAIIHAFRQFPSAHFYVCGKRREWIGKEVEIAGLKNVHYLGLLDYATHDAVLKRCHIGLLLYEHSYYDLMATAKYSAYVAKGLAVLSTDLVTLSEILREDRVGVASTIEELPTRLAHWLESPEELAPYRERARELSSNFVRGLYMQEWFDQAVLDLHTARRGPAGPNRSDDGAQA
ncbi:MAG: hypothetical protein V3R24_09120 [Gemmatimonadales bacterium]